jgi:hypothetical protein
MDQNANRSFTQGIETNPMFIPPYGYNTQPQPFNPYMNSMYPTQMMISPNNMNFYPGYNPNMTPQGMNQMNRSMPNLGGLNQPFNAPPNYNRQMQLLANYNLMEQFNQFNVEEEMRRKILDAEKQKQRERDMNINKEIMNEFNIMQKEVKNINEIISPLQLLMPRSDHIDLRDRYFFEELLLQPLKTAGLFGTENIKLDKSLIIGQENNYLVEQNMNYFFKMSKDGIYIDYIKNLITTYNLQKIEQRALREGKTDWFRLNGDIRLENDIFSDVITKPCDISLTTNDRYNIQYISNKFSDRGGVRNSKIYKMKIYINKLQFSNHPLFNDEDKICAEVKRLYRVFYEEMNMLRIPYLKEKLSVILKQYQIYEKEKNPNPALLQEMKYIQMFISETKTFLEEAKEKLNAKANLLYSTWLRLKKLRDDQKFQSTNLKLSVLKFQNGENWMDSMFDYAFILHYSDPTADTKIIPRRELDRRSRIIKVRSYVKIYINGVYVTKSDIYNLTWPNFELVIDTLFNVNIYTRPTKIELELYQGNITFDKIARFEIEAPGIFMNTVTSTSTLMEEVNFEINEEVKRVIKKQKLLLAEENGIQTIRNNRFKGSVLIKAEWEGLAPDMPPTKIENKIELYSKQREFREMIQKSYKYDFPYDINDPRNVGIFEAMKKKKTELLLKYLFREYLIPYSDTESLRHFLCRMRLERLSMKNKILPILEKLIDLDLPTKKLIDEIKTELKLKFHEQYEEMIKAELEKINSYYNGKILSDEEYKTMINQKIKALRRDIIVKMQLSYYQVISEYYYSMDVVKTLFSTLVQAFEPARRLKPQRARKIPQKVEKCDKLKVSLHIIKGYNIPVRFESIPKILKEQIKANAIDQVYRSNVAGANPMFKNFINNELKNSYRMNQGGGGFPYPPMGGTPGIATGGNGSFNMPNPMFDPNYNNPNIINSMSNPNMYPMPMPMAGGFNPNVGNVMFNPNYTNPMPMYNQPNIYMNNNNAINYDGDILQMIEVLRNVEKNVESFIQCKIVFYDQEIEKRSDCIDGLHPDYNFKMDFDLRPQKGQEYFTREDISQCPGYLYFTVYDEVRTREDQIKEKDATTYIYRYEKKYLGSFKIPFTTILENDCKLEAICKVDIPLTVFGYYSDSSSTFDLLNNITKEKGDLSSDGRLRSDALKVVNPSVNSYVSLYITLDPIFSVMGSDNLDYVPGFEDSIFLINTIKWLKKLKEKRVFGQRNIRVFVENFDGFSVFLPRYLKPQEPPRIVYDPSRPMDDNCIEKAARYVSLIPFVPDSQAFTSEELPDCWCTDEQFLTLGFGDYEEHAILLCNYFNYIDLVQNRDAKSYVLLGKAYPEGYTTYVIRISKGLDVEIWNAKTGDCFYFDKRFDINNFLCFTVSKNYRNRNTLDNICPMKEIGCIISDENIYINCSESVDPAVLDFNLQDKKHWMPFLT